MIKEDEIKLIAYGIWQEEGCQNGQDRENWIRAEEIWDQKQKQKSVTKDIRIESKQPITQNTKDKTVKNNPKTGISTQYKSN
jgi:hypothetical protein